MKDVDEMLGQKGWETDCWVLALDTLYHFSPSREPLFGFAGTNIRASIMAYDLLLADDTPLFSRFLLSFIGVLMGCPFDAFKTEREYKELLERCGYDKSKIEMRDISEHIFRPLSQFLHERDTRLQRYGWGLGKLKAAEWLFGWWARSELVRGVIIVARR
jgi:hypothetical protein